MSTSSLIIRYDGPALANHKMDVAELAPALIGISELVKLANKKYNGDRAAVHVLIGTDQEHKCFQLSLEIIQNIWQQAQTLLGIHADDIKTAEDILHVLGLVTAPAFGLFKLLKWLAERKASKAEIQINESDGNVTLSVKGDYNQITVNKQVFEMANEPTAIVNAKRVVAPLLKLGFESLEFEENGLVGAEFTRETAEQICSLDSNPIPEIKAEEPQTITAWIKVFSPVYDLGADQWRFVFNDRHEYMDISETDIAAHAVKRGGSLIDDTYKVRLELQQTKTASGNFKAKYKIKEVLEFHPARMRDGNQETLISGGDC